MQTILYFIEVSCPGGAQNVLLNILDGLNRSKYRPIVALLEKGWLEETLRSKGYEVIIVNSTNKSFDWRLIKDTCCHYPSWPGGLEKKFISCN